VELVILKSLMKDPAGRYQTAAEMADAIRAAIPERAVELEPTLLEPQEPAPKVEEESAVVQEAPVVEDAPVEPSMSKGSAYPDPAIIKEVEQAAAIEAPASRPMSGVDVALTVSLIILFGLIAVVSGFLAFLFLFADGLELFPAVFGIAVGALGVMAMVWFHRRYPMSWLILLAAAIMWFIGGGLFALGISATFLGTAEFAENLGFAVGLCMGPGGFLALAGLALYIFAARRSRKNAS
jgi:hypothetical protein